MEEIDTLKKKSNKTVHNKQYILLWRLQKGSFLKHLSYRWSYNLKTQFLLGMFQLVIFPWKENSHFCKKKIPLSHQNLQQTRNRNLSMLMKVFAKIHLSPSPFRLSLNMTQLLGNNRGMYKLNQPRVFLRGGVKYMNCALSLM